MPENASLIRVCASAAVYLALMVSFWVRKDSTLACSRCEASVSFSSSPWSWALLRLEVGHLAGERRLAGQRLAGEVLAAHRQRLLGLLGELVGLLLQLGRLELDPLAARRDVGHAAAYLRQQLELPLVAVVERLARVLGAVERLVRLGAEDQADALHETHEGGPPFLCSVMRSGGRRLHPTGQRTGGVGGSRTAPDRLALALAGHRGSHDRRPGRPAATSRKSARCSVAARPPKPRPRPRPSRRAARAAPPPAARRRRPPPRARAKGPQDKKAAARAQRERRTESSATIREGMKRGDERYLPARDKGPVRRFVRDWIDARLCMAELLLPLLILIMVGQAFSPAWPTGCGARRSCWSPWTPRWWSSGSGASCAAGSRT